MTSHDPTYRADRPSWLPVGVAPVLTVGAGAEAGALARAGLVADLLPGRRVATDVALSPTDRAAALAGIVPRGAVVVLTAAAWVHLGGEPPAVVDVALTTPSRTRSQRLRFHVTHYRETGLERRAGLEVTTRLQTAADLLRHAVSARGTSEPGTRGAELTAFRELVRSGVSPDAVATLLLSEPRRTGHRLATELLARLAPSLPTGPAQTDGTGRPEGTGAASGRTPVTR